MNLIAAAAVLFILVPLKAEENSVNFRGDFRFRNESETIEQSNTFESTQRNRQQIRTRVYVEGRSGQDTGLTFRLAGGTSNSSGVANTFKDLSDYSAKKEVVLDAAFAWYKPDEKSIYELGKMFSPFYANGSQDLIFDDDITFDGLTYKFKSKDATTPYFISAGAYWLSENFSSLSGGQNNDVGLVGMQFGRSFGFDNKALMLAVSHFNFLNTKSSAAAAPEGNSISGGNYLNDYKLFALDADFQIYTSYAPLHIFVQYAENSEVSEHKSGVLVGFRYGKNLKPGEWTFFYDYREVQKDSVLGILSDSEVAGGGTDIRNHRVKFIIQVLPETNAVITFQTGERELSLPAVSPKYQKVNIDLNFRL